MIRILLLILLQGCTVSIGLGYDMEDDFKHQEKDVKGIIHIEGKNYGFWHSSRINNGFKGDPDDQNIFYIKYRIK